MNPAAAAGPFVPARRARAAAGFTLVELLIVVTIVGVVAAISASNLVRARLTANEASAISSLRVIQTAQVSFRWSCTEDRAYAAALPQLGAARMISPDLAGSVTVLKSGYAITLATVVEGPGMDRCTEQPTALEWYASAVPMAVNSGGSRGFATSEGESIWQDGTGAAPPEPFAESGNVSRVD
jgi:prepilin-type N-terminal cleavage/methylation domain-containing protein